MKKLSNRNHGFLCGVGVYLFLLRLTPVYATSLTTEQSHLRLEIERQEPVSFRFLHPPNPWSKGDNIHFYNNELHRLYIDDSTLNDALENSVLNYLNNPKNRKFVVLRRYVAYFRRTSRPNKPAGEAYIRAGENAPIYLLHTRLEGNPGSMTQINVANLILPGSWIKNHHQANLSDGKEVYDYILLTDGMERTFEDLWNNKSLFEQMLTHMTLILLEAEARGQQRGLEAHLAAHSLPDVHMAYGNTWCETRAFFESWPLAQSTLLAVLFPEAFPPFAAESLLERDRFLYFSTSPWQETFSPLARIRPSWNTPQAILNSHFVNAALLMQFWRDASLGNPWAKSIMILTRQGAGQMREFVRDWLNVFPEDRAALSAHLRLLSHDLIGQSSDDPFACSGSNVWIGLMPKFDHVDFNSSGTETISLMLSRLSERMPNEDRECWMHAVDKDYAGENLFPVLAQEIYEYRGKTCRQFASLFHVENFIRDFGQRHGLPKSAISSLLRVIAFGAEEVRHYYTAERQRLIQIGAYRNGR